MRQRQETIGPIVTRALDCAANPWLVQYIAPGGWSRTESQHKTIEQATARVAQLVAAEAAERGSSPRPAPGIFNKNCI